MGELGTMTLDEVRTWALGRGFEQTRPGTLSCPFGRFRVDLEFLKRSVRATLHGEGGGERRLLTAHPGRLRVNDMGVIEGLGLSTTFAVWLRHTPEVPVPAWMRGQYAMAVVGRAE